MMKIMIQLIFIASLITGFAQDGAKIEQAKIGYITNKLNLTSAEAEKFWPIYNEYKNKLKSSRKEMRTEIRDLGDLENMSDKEAEATLNDIVSMEQRNLDLRKEYLLKFKQILPTKKILLWLKAEKDFNKEVIMNMRRRP